MVAEEESGRLGGAKRASESDCENENGSGS